MTQEHPFAQYVRILARGPGRSRALTFDEARDAMRMIVAGQAEPVQLGAMLMLMRYRQESPEELAGFVASLRESFTLSAARPPVDLDWPSYAAGRTRGAPWFLLSALLLAQNGVRVAMHGHARSKLASALASLGIEPGLDSLSTTNFAFLPLATFSPTAQQLLDLRPLLGLRSPANSVARLLNPLAAPAVVQGVFHPAYRELQRGAAALLGEKCLAVFKGGGGEAERNPDKSCRLYIREDGRDAEEEWTALAGVPAAASDAEPELIEVWRGERNDDGVVRTIVATAAVALRFVGRAQDQAAADRLADDLWLARDRSRFSAHRLEPVAG